MKNELSSVLDKYIRQPEPPRPKETSALPHDGFLFLGRLLQDTLHTEPTRIKKALFQKAQELSPKNRWFYLTRMGEFRSDAEEGFAVTAHVHSENDLLIAIRVRGGRYAVLQAKFSGKDLWLPDKLSQESVHIISKSVEDVSLQLRSFVIDSITQVIAEKQRAKFTKKVARNLTPDHMRFNIAGIFRGEQDKRRTKGWLHGSDTYWGQYWDTKRE